jgi:hypothetical protein
MGVPSLEEAQESFQSASGVLGLRRAAAPASNSLGPQQKREVINIEGRPCDVIIDNVCYSRDAAEWILSEHEPHPGSGPPGPGPVNPPPNRPTKAQCEAADNVCRSAPGKNQNDCQHDLFEDALNRVAYGLFSGTTNTCFGNDKALI